MKSDFHLHSLHSADSEASMESMAENGIIKGLKTMCFTEHMDYDTPTEMGDFTLDTQSYYKEFLKLKKKYESRIELLFGVELGLQPHLIKKHEDYIKSWPFDYIIGSSHVVEGCDPYYPRFFQEHGEEEGYRLYFNNIMNNIQAFSDFDSYGHLDYVVRYGPNKNKAYSYEKYKDVIDPALELLIEKKIALEVNSGGLKYGLGEPNPCTDILRAYRRMGGDLVTIGSDAHNPGYIAYEFDKIADILRKCGYRHYTEYRRREPRNVEI